MKYYFLLILFLLTGCDIADAIDDPRNCDEQMKDTRTKYGDPEEVNTYDASDYHSHDWWYWSQGFEYTFIWGRDQSCQVSLYQFPAIAKTDIQNYKIEMMDPASECELLENSPADTIEMLCF